MRTDTEARAVVTGIGVLTLAGYTLDDLWEFLLNQSSVRDSSPGSAHRGPIIGGEELETDGHADLPPKKLKYVDRQVVFCMVAALRALDDAGLRESIGRDQALDDIGVVCGNQVAQIEFGIRQMEKMVAQQSLNISPYTGLAFYFGAGTAEISVLLGTRGENSTVISGSCTGVDSLGRAALSISRGVNKIVLAGAADNVLPQFLTSAFAEGDKLATGPYLPFDLTRSGCYISSGGGIAVVESLCVARRRGARIYGEIAAYVTLTAYRCLYHPDVQLLEVIERAVLTCCQQAGIQPGDIDLIIPTADGSRDGDAYELEALRRVFGTRRRCVFSPKPNVGHMLSASGILDLVVAAKAIERNQIPPFRVPVDTGDPQTDGLFVCGDSENRAIDRVLILQRDIFGGRVSALLVHRVS